MDKFIKCMNGIPFELKRDFDFNWLSNYGEVFCVFDQQDSGNICFGIKDGKRKIFIKYAGAPTINYDGKYESAVSKLRNAVKVYEDIKHPNLIKIVDYFEQSKGYVSVFEWVDGECLHAHWNFDKYPKYNDEKSPNVRFKKLELKHKIDCINKIYSFHEEVSRKGYVAIDFYDGSIMYDFDKNEVMICDIDYYTKRPLINNIGRMCGSSRFMSPEEFEKGAIIDEISNVFTMGAMAFELLGNNKDRSFSSWIGSKELFKIAKKLQIKIEMNDINQ